ncbi:mycothiol system anti-sigma-R factor [Thalassiella azotivora]
MSCGNHHDTDCREVLDRVYEYLDAEVTQDDLAKIKQHLDECGPCLAEYDIEDHLRALVRRSCHESAPETLRVRILAQITSVRVHMEG